MIQTGPSNTIISSIKTTNTNGTITTHIFESKISWRLGEIGDSAYQ